MKNHSHVWKDPIFAQGRYRLQYKCPAKKLWNHIGNHYNTHNYCTSHEIFVVTRFLVSKKSCFMTLCLNSFINNIFVGKLRQRGCIRQHIYGLSGEIIDNIASDKDWKRITCTIQMQQYTFGTIRGAHSHL